MKQTIGTFLIGIITNLITPFIAPIIAILLGFYLSTTLELKLIFFCVALSISTIILILSQRFSPQKVRVVRISEQDHVYLVEKRLARHIPDMKTFEYLSQLYGFIWTDIEIVSQDEFNKRFLKGSTLPSIHPLCVAFHERKIKEELEKSVKKAEEKDRA